MKLVGIRFLGIESHDMSHKENMNHNESRPMVNASKTGVAVLEAFSRYRPLLPFIFGLALARAGIIIGNFQSYRSTTSEMADLSLMLSLAVIAIILCILIITRVSFNDVFVRRAMYLFIVCDIAIMIVYSLNWLSGEGLEWLFWTLEITNALVTFGMGFYWLRRARGSSPTTAVILIFAAILISEIIIYLGYLVSLPISYLMAAACALLQIPCMTWSNKSPEPAQIGSTMAKTDYFGFAKTMISSRSFIFTTTAGIAIFSIVTGLLRSYPGGEGIFFSPDSRLICALLTILLCISTLTVALWEDRHLMTVGIWIVMQVLACLAVLSYAFFPNDLDIGAIFATTLTAMMTIFIAYVIVAFSSYGSRDSYFYALCGWFVWLFCRGLSRIILDAATLNSANTTAIIAVVMTVLVFSIQVVFIQFIDILNKGKDAESKSRQSIITSFLGLEAESNHTSARFASMKHNAEELGKQFLLSEREIEVVTYYALGYTQRHVADELYISPSTAHSHIKRIYAKTNLHSREEILEYMKRYGT